MLVFSFDEKDLFFLMDKGNVVRGLILIMFAI